MKNLKIFKSIAIILLLLLGLSSCGEKEDIVKEGDTDLLDIDNSVGILEEGEQKDAIAKNGNKVFVNYILTDENGEKLESSYDIGSPLSFTIGDGGMIAGFNDAVVGMKVGEKKTVTLAPVDAYGERDESLTEIIPKSELASFEEAGYKLEKGEVLSTMIGKIEILEADEETITVDGNHPMAGKTLTFEIELVEMN